MADFTEAAFSPKQYQFLSGGGEMGQLIRAKDWSDTFVGTPDGWPQSLRTSLSIVLNAKFPMFLWWGKDLTCFYNDAYRPSLGNNGKHPGILGMPAEKAWAEIWHVIKPLIDQVLAGGESPFFEDTLVPIYRNGKIEDVYWTFSYSAVNDESGKPAGVFVTCFETTHKVVGAKKIEHGENRFKNLIKESPIATAIFTGEDFIVELANKEALKLWGKDENVIGKKIIAAMPELEGQPYMDLLKNVYTTGETYNGNENFVNIEVKGKVIPTYINFIYKALRNEEDEIYGILAMGYDVTEQVEARKKIEYNEERAMLAMDTAMLGMVDITLPAKEFTSTKRVYEIFGFADTTPSYQTLLSHIHPDDVNIRKEAIRLAHITGNVGYEVRIVWPDKTIHWISVYGKLFYDKDKNPTRVLNTIMDITAQKMSIKSYQASERKFRNVIMQSPIAMAIFRGKDYVIEIANTEMFKNIWRKEKDEVIGKELFNVFPQLHEPKYKKYPAILNGVLTTAQSYRDSESVAYIHGDDGVIKKFYFDCEYSPLQEADGTVLGIMLTINDVTASVEAREKLKVEEARLRLAIEGTSLATWDLDLKKRSIIHSPRLTEIFGHDPSVVLTHRQMRDQIHPDDFNNIVERSFKMAIAEGVYSYEARVIKPDLTIAWIKTEGKVIFGTNGVPLRMIGTLADITASKFAEEKLVMLAAIVESSEDAIISKTLDGVISSWNDGAQKIFGYTADEIIGQNITKLIPLDRLNEEPQIVQRIQKGESVEHFETKRITKDKRALDISLTISPIKDVSGNIIGASKIARDITKQKQTENLVAENQLRLNIAIQAAELGTWEYDIETGDATYSDRYLEIFGHAPTYNFTRQSILDQIHPDDLQLRNEALKDAIEKTGVMNFDVRIIIHENETRWIQVKGKLIYNNDVPLKLMGTIMDITDEKRAAENIKESEGRFRLLSNVMPQFIWTGDPQGNLYYFNQSVYAYSGLTEEQAMNGGWLQIVHPDDKEENIKKWMHSVITGEDFIFEHRFRKYDGEYRWQLSRAVPHRNSNGEIQMWIGTSTDINDQKMFSDRLQKSELLFKTISNASPVGLWMTDVNGENNFVNDTWIKWTGMSLEEQYIHGWLDNVLEEDKKGLPSFKLAFGRREKYTAEFRITRQDEEIRWCLTEGYPFYDTNGDFEGYAGSVTDITDIKKLEQQKDFFISMASHELKTPITSIKGYVQILQSMHKDSPDTFLKNALKTVNKQVGTLTKLITDLLDMSKIKSGSLQLNKDEFPLNEMIHETIEEIKHTQPDFDIMFSQEKENIVYADRLRISQVLINFLTNAIKYSPYFKLVTVKTTVVEKNVIVSVIDSGIGISKSDQQKIFQRFYRVEGSDEKTFPGFGIGLFIAAEIIQRHEGEISVESEPGKGSVFSFSLPIEKLI